MRSERTSNFCFLIHPRSITDIYVKYPYLRVLPSALVERAMSHLKPVPVASITGFRTPAGKSLLGTLVAVPYTAARMLADRERARAKVLEAVAYCKTLGATHVGLGAYTSVVTDGGSWLREQVAGINLTNGNSLTALMSFRGYLEVRKTYVDTAEPIIAIIGATGSIGGALAKQIAETDAFSSLLIVGKTPSHIADLMGTLQRYPNAAKIQAVSLEEAAGRADIVLVATSASSALFSPQSFKRNAVIYDLSQPQNITQDIVNERGDLSVFIGGLVQLPAGVRYGHDFGIPRDSMFSCMAETALLASVEYEDHFCLEHVTHVHLEKIAAIADQFAIEPALVPFGT